MIEDLKYPVLHLKNDLDNNIVEEIIEGQRKIHIFSKATQRVLNDYSYIASKEAFIKNKNLAYKNYGNKYLVKVTNSSIKYDEHEVYATADNFDYFPYFTYLCVAQVFKDVAQAQLLSKHLDVLLQDEFKLSTKIVVVKLNAKQFRSEFINSSNLYFKEIANEATKKGVSNEQ